MTVRPAMPHDASTIARVERLAAHRPWDEAAILAHLADPCRIALIVDGPTEAIGHVLASSAADEGEVLTIAVAPTARRQGLATTLLHALYARWNVLGVGTAWLEVRADNVGAQRLYLSDGWEEAGRRKAYYHDGVDAVVMRREVM